MNSILALMSSSEFRIVMKVQNAKNPQSFGKPQKLGSGFSLIELLVVVAIIGVLATVGLLVFRSYINTSKDAVASDSFHFIQRQINQDLVSLRNDLNAKSRLADALSVDSQCMNMRDEYIKKLNERRDNPFNESQGAVCDGNYLATGPALSGGIAGQPSVVNVGRGQTMVFCAGTNLDSAMFAPVAGVVGLNYCTCAGTDSCATQMRRTGTIAAGGITGAGRVLRIDIAAGVPASLRSTVPAQLQISGAVYSVLSGTLSGANQWDVTITPALDSAVSVGAVAVEINKGICFTPIGAASDSIYFGAYSTYGSQADLAAVKGVCATSN